MAELTPMKRQYQEIKAQHQDCLLFFRLGDFYEMFDEDAKLASRELDIALTTRDRNVEDPEERTPMCGVPYHSAEAYIARLIAKGYKVAICEQTEDPALAKGLVSREVIRIITPGTVTESSMLEEGRSNYITAVTAPEFGSVMLNTLIWVVSVVGLSTLLGFIVALVLNTEFHERTGALCPPGGPAVRRGRTGECHP